MTETADRLQDEGGETDDVTAPAAAEEELAFNHPGGDSLELADLLTGRTMARRLPSLIRRTFSLAWQVDRKAVVALLACQVASGISGALGLFATTAALSVLIETAHDASRLPAAVPAVAVLAGTAGVRALLGIVIQALSNRLSPRICREAEYKMLEAATHAEQAAYDHPGFNDRYDAAERGVDVSRDMIGQSQNYISSLTTLTAAGVVLVSLYPLLLPLLLLAAVPQAIAAIRGERITYLAVIATHKDRRVMTMLRWHLIAKHQADQVRTDTLAPYLLGKYRASAERVEATSDTAAWERAKIAVVGAAAAGLASSAVWGAVFWLLGSGRISAAAVGTAVFALRSAAAVCRDSSATAGTCCAPGSTSTTGSGSSPRPPANAWTAAPSNPQGRATSPCGTSPSDIRRRTRTPSTTSTSKSARARSWLSSERTARANQH
jgi:ATP-binding cassette subfamily B protein